MADTGAMADQHTPFLASLVLAAACLLSTAVASPAAAAPEPAAEASGTTTGTTTRFTPDGDLPCCGKVEISGDGRYVTHGAGGDLFQFDRTTKTVTRITDGDSSTPSFRASTDARFVAFTSDATNLIPGEVSDVRSAYLWDRTTGTTIALSHIPGVTPQSSSVQAMTPDGRFIVVESNGQLTGGEATAMSNLFLYDRAAQTMTAITDGDGPSTGSLAVLDENVDVLLSPDGRYVTFTSWATDLTATTGEGVNAYQWDRLTGTTTAITTDAVRVEPLAASPDGRYVTFVGRLPAPSGTAYVSALAQWDRTTGATATIESIAGFDLPSARSVSTDGAQVVFWDQNTSRLWNRSTGTASDLVPTGNDAWAWTDDASKVVVTLTSQYADIPGGPLRLYDRAAGTFTPISASKPANQPTKVLLSADGETVTWTSSATNEVPGTSTGTRTPYQWSRSTGAVIALAVPDQAVDLRAQSPDASLVALQTKAVTLEDGTPPGTNGFVWDRSVVPSVPGAPRSVYGIPGNGAADVEWVAPVLNGSSTLTGYQVELAPPTGSPQTQVVGATTTTAQVAGLTNGTTYQVRVRARNADGWGPWSLRASTVPATAPGAPTAVTATAGDGRADVRWQPPADNGGLAVVRYAVQPAVDGVPVGDPVSTTGATSVRVNGLTNGTEYTFTVTAWNQRGSSPASSPSTAVTPRPPGPAFVPVTPCRLADTRSDGGPIAPGTARGFTVTDGGSCTIPADALALEATITAVAPTGSGFLRAYPPGSTPPNATFLNYAKGEDATNTGSMAVTPSPAPGVGLTVRTYGSATNVVIDVQGYYRRPLVEPEGALFVPATPCRAFDSRQGSGARLLGAGERRDVVLVGQTGCAVPASAVAVEATVTAVDSPGSGFLRAWPAGAAAPTATFLTHTGGRSTTNTGTIGIRPGAGHSNLAVRNFGTPSHVVVDVQGWWIPAPAPPAATFVARRPCRILDTRAAGAPVAPGAGRAVTVTGVAGCNVPDDAVAIEATITAVGPSNSGFLRVWPTGAGAPTATFLNYAKGRSTTNTGAVSIKPGAGPNLQLRNFAGPAHFVIEIQGWYVPTD